jgi:hypothetical protein
MLMGVTPFERDNWGIKHLVVWNVVKCIGT